MTPGDFFMFAAKSASSVLVTLLVFYGLVAFLEDFHKHRPYAELVMFILSVAGSITFGFFFFNLL